MGWDYPNHLRKFSIRGPCTLNVSITSSEAATTKLTPHIFKCPWRKNFQGKSTSQLRNTAYMNQSMKCVCVYAHWQNTYFPNCNSTFLNNYRPPEDKWAKPVTTRVLISHPAMYVMLSTNMTPWQTILEIVQWLNFLNE